MNGDDQMLLLSWREMVLGILMLHIDESCLLSVQLNKYIYIVYHMMCLLKFRQNNYMVIFK